MSRTRDPDGLAERLFHAHGGRVRRFLLALTGRADVAEDLTQEVFLHVVRAAASYEPRGREKAWLFQIARRVAADRWRSARREPVGAAAGEAVQPPSQVLRLGLVEALRALSPDEREAFVLCEVGGLTYVEIAEALGTTAPAVRSLLYRGRLRLRELVVAPPPGPRPAPSGHQGDSDDS